MAMFSTTRLPETLVSRILDYLSLPEITLCSHISREWRAAAQVHPRYLTRIVLGEGGTLTDSDAKLFLDRIQVNPDGDLALRLFLDRLGPRSVAMDNTIRERIIPALSAALHRLVNLVVTCDNWLMDDILEALISGPAPKLERFHFCRPVEAFSSSLPTQIFAGQAPRLQDMTTDCCEFPETVSPAFSRVRRLTCQFKLSACGIGMTAIKPERFFTSCPALQDLTIVGYGWKIKQASWAACAQTAIAQLRRLTVGEVYDAAATHAVVQALSRPHTTAVNVDTAYVSAETLNLMLDDLYDSPRLRLGILCNNDHLYCSVADDARRRERRMSHPLGDPWASLLHGPDGRLESLRPCFVDIADRFSHLYISAHEAAWDFLLAFLPDSVLTKVETLTVLPISDEFEHMAFNGTLRLPSLKLIELHSEEKVMHLREAALVNLVESLLPGLRQKLIVDLKNVRVIINGNMTGNHFMFRQYPCFFVQTRYSCKK